VASRKDFRLPNPGNAFHPLRVPLRKTLYKISNSIGRVSITKLSLWMLPTVQKYERYFVHPGIGHMHFCCRSRLLGVVEIVHCIVPASGWDYKTLFPAQAGTQSDM
jgi:hypothetical protein